MKLLAKILPVIVVLTLIAVGCKKPEGSKRVRCDLVFHRYNAEFGVPWCDSIDPYAQNSVFKWPYSSVISSQDTFDYYFGCIDTTYFGSPNYPAEVDTYFLDFNDHDLILFNVAKMNVLMDSYRITNDKLFVDDENKILYLSLKQHYSGGGSNLTYINYLYFIEIPKGYEDYEVSWRIY